MVNAYFIFTNPSLKVLPQLSYKMKNGSSYFGQVDYFHLSYGLADGYGGDTHYVLGGTAS